VNSTADKIGLRCTRSGFEALEEAEETDFLPRASGRWGYESRDWSSIPAIIT